MRNYGERKCVWCGKVFMAHSAKAQSCGDDHYRPCARCGQPLLVKESYVNYMKYGPRTCSECRKIVISEGHQNRSAEAKLQAQQKREATNLERYGAANPLQRSDIKEKVHQTVKSRYGVDNLSQSAEIQERIKQHSLELYGVDHYSKDPEIRARMVQGMLDKYGVASPMQSEELRQHIQSTNLERYGHENALSNEDIQAKVKATCLKRYGVEYAAQADEIIKQRTETNFKKYGGPAYIFSPEYLKTTVVNPDRYNYYEQFKSDPKNYILTQFDHKPTYKELSESTGVCDTTISYYIVKYCLHDLVQCNISNMEQDITNIIHTTVPDAVIIPHSRSIISPYEIDIYLPDYKLGIECNPTWTHNSDIAFMHEGNIVPKSYHKDKSDLAQQAGIRLIHVFGYDWVNHKDIMVSMLRNALGNTTRKLFARNLHLREVSWSDAREFLRINHRQGPTTCSIRLGLYDNDELVSLMTFGKMRNLSGRINNEDSWELSRFCSKLNYNVVGGASKLFSYFCRHWYPDKIVSFSDIATTSGNLYKILGFVEIHRSDPGYVWVDPNSECYYNRVTCQKSNLKKLLRDDTIDVEHNTEVEIMTAHGYGRVFDSGVIRWEYTPSSNQPASVSRCLHHLDYSLIIPM